MNEYLTRRSIGWAGLLLVTVGIVANGLFVQSSPHPAPWFHTRVATTETRRFLPDPEDRERILRIQRGLSRIGYYTGPVDGLPGPGTEAALVSFWSGTGRSAAIGDWRAIERQIDQAVALVPERPPIPDPRPDPRVLAVQEALARAAYGPLDTDGVAGPATSAAIRRFQETYGLPPNGEIDDALLTALISVGAMPPSDLRQTP